MTVAIACSSTFGDQREPPITGVTQQPDTSGAWQNRCDWRACLPFGAGPASVGDQVETGTWRRGISAEGLGTQPSLAVASGLFASSRPRGPGRLPTRIARISEISRSPCSFSSQEMSGLRPMVNDRFSAVRTWSTSAVVIVSGALPVFRILAEADLTLYMSRDVFGLARQRAIPDAEQ